MGESNAVPVPGTYDVEIRTPVKEDHRLFYKSAKHGLRLFHWYPFEAKFWPFSEYGEKDLKEYRVSLLQRSYDAQTGTFYYTITGPRQRLESGEHPDKTKAYVGFMISSDDGAMAALLIPDSAKRPND